MNSSRAASLHTHVVVVVHVSVLEATVPGWGIPVLVHMSRDGFVDNDPENHTGSSSYFSRVARFLVSIRAWFGTGEARGFASFADMSGERGRLRLANGTL